MAGSMASGEVTCEWVGREEGSGAVGQCDQCLGC